jgi:ribA/ribD-fused uncharacterized protein
MTIIDRFTRESGYEFLSNFYPSTISFEGRLYPTVEHAYQAAKTLDPKIREFIRKANGPLEAKKLGQGILKREDWEQIKIDVMRKLIKEKFSNPFLTHKLIATGDAQLILGNKWNDKFWGVCKGTGENWLGKILMEIRSELQIEIAKDADIQFAKVD